MSFPENQTHQQFLKELEQTVEETGEISRKDLADKFDGNDYSVSGSTAKAFLSAHRETIEQETELVSVQDPRKDENSGGKTTVYWRLDN